MYLPINATRDGGTMKTGWRGSGGCWLCEPAPPRSPLAWEA